MIDEMESTTTCRWNKLLILEKITLLTDKFVLFRNCGEMVAQNTQSYQVAPVCASDSKILYAWAMDAPMLKLPDGKLATHLYFRRHRF